MYGRNNHSPQGVPIGLNFGDMTGGSVFLVMSFPDDTKESRETVCHVKFKKMFKPK